MARVGPLEINDNILDAIRDDKLVIFAGAGVSMGPPANLPSFFKLATRIAAGTGITLEKKEPIDRFLGRLEHQKIKIHQRAAYELSQPGSAPTQLHVDLLRIFRGPERVRIVTTNFDLHFETASKTIFDKNLDVFRAPALPLGRNLQGLVHIHGALTHPLEMVLTDGDFGRGYLTEGWARRFLVDVFRTYTVLFVGYSHNDVVMNYLARALPADGFASRYALTEEVGDWKLLGITPILFRKGKGKKRYQELYEGVHLLSERARRGALDWKTQLMQIGRGVPPTDEEAVDEIEQALREVHTTRFLLDVARHAEWPKWLNIRKKMDALFEPSPLDERDKLLVFWLAEHYAIEHADVIFEIIASKNMKLNPTLWWSIGRELGLEDKKICSDNTLSRWVTILLACAPRYFDCQVLEWLADRCAKQGKLQLVQEIFLFMAGCRLTIKSGFKWPGYDNEKVEERFDVQTLSHVEHYNLNEIWNNHLKPNIAVISQSLLSGIVRQLEEIHEALRAWDKAGGDWDAASYGRSAIETHEQDQFPEPIDVLIDAARDTLKCLARNKPLLLGAWIEQLIVSDVPLLRRLAINAYTEHSNEAADVKLNWLMGNLELYAQNEYHEVHRAVQLAYPSASNTVRQKVINAVLIYKLPDDENQSSVDRTARAHFNWLIWLNLSDPTCMLVQTALNPIKLAHPEWTQSKYPDLLHWSSSGFSGPRSPWTVEQLLTNPPSEQLDDLISFKGDWFEGPDRGGLLAAIQEACKQNKAWAFKLDESLSDRSIWDSDLWAPMLRGLREADLKLEDWGKLLNSFGRSELYTVYSHEIANLIYELVRDGGKSFGLELLDQANIIALHLWQSLHREEEEDEIKDWISTAINRPAGVVVEFWINSLSMVNHSIPADERTLPDYYRDRFTAVVHDNTNVGGLGRSLLASQVAFLSALDKDWTNKEIISLFSSTDERKFLQAWDGFLVWGRLNTSLVEALQPAFLSALPRLVIASNERRRRFIEFFTAIAIFHVNDPTLNFLPSLFNYGSPDDLVNFAYHIGVYLRQMDNSTRQDLWNRWLRLYWENRLDSIPVQLSESEARNMLEWLLYLDELFTEGVSLAARMSITQIKRSHLVHEMEKSELVIQFPIDTAELLIYLCPLLEGYQIQYISKIEKRLTPLSSGLRLRLDEAMAKAGIAKIE